MKKINTGIVLATLLTISLNSSVFAYIPLSSQLDFGEKNSDVTNLQEFFADNSAIYPEGLVTGYFGGLTKNAVVKFQAEYGLAQVGRVGPMTQEKINNLISTGGWTMADISGPAISSVVKTVSNNSATFVWNTDEMASAKAYYSTSPLTMIEGNINSSGFMITSGYAANNDGTARMSQQITFSNLNPNTKYYYVLVSTDLKGNVSLVGPNNTFNTN